MTGVENIEKNFEPTEQDIENIRQWVVNMPHLVQVQDDDYFKALFRACKGRLQKTKEAYEKLNSFGMTYPDMLGHLDPLNEITQYYLNNTYLFVIPQKTDDGSRILITASKSNELDANMFSSFEIARYIFMSFLVLLWENSVEDSKFILIYDCQTTRLSELKTCTPNFLKNFVTFITAGLPIRFQAGHFVNIPNFVQPILNFIKSVAPKKISNRIHFHSSMDELYELIPKKVLPKEFGGYGEDVDTLHYLWKKKVESYRDQLVSENKKMRSLDHLRPKSNDFEELQGSFRKLEVD